MGCLMFDKNNGSKASPTSLAVFFRVSFEARDLSDHWRHRHGQVGVVSLLGDGAQVCWLDPNFPSVFGTFLGVFRLSPFLDTYIDVVR